MFCTQCATSTALERERELKHGEGINRGEEVMATLLLEEEEEEVPGK